MWRFIRKISNTCVHEVVWELDYKHVDFNYRVAYEAFFINDQSYRVSLSEKFKTEKLPNHRSLRFPFYCYVHYSILLLYYYYYYYCIHAKPWKPGGLVLIPTVNMSSNELFIPYQVYVWRPFLPPHLSCNDRKRPTAKRRDRSTNFSTKSRKMQPLLTPLALGWSSKTSTLSVSHAPAMIDYLSLAPHATSLRALSTTNCCCISRVIRSVCDITRLDTKS